MINIKELIPFMKDGWVAMDESGDWNWYKDKPECDNDEDYIWKGGFDLVYLNPLFDIAPVDDWTKSLIQVKGVKAK